MDQRQREQWEQTRAKGKRRFILLITIVMSGSMIIGMSLFDYFFGSRGFRSDELYFKVPIYLITGFLAGLAFWFIAEYRYQKSSKNTDR